jgi:trehalose-phosphatase
MSTVLSFSDESSSAKADTGASIGGRTDRAPVPPTSIASTTADHGGKARSALQAWPEIRTRLRSASRCAVFLDFDGTLVNLRNRPGDVTAPLTARRTLERLARNPKVLVAIVSGRKLDDLRRLVGVEGVTYFGLHGGERDGQSAELSPGSALALENAKQAARAQLGELPGVWIEDKGLTFSVHHRVANEEASDIARAELANLLSPWRDVLHVLNGSKVWEILPREIPGKQAAVEHVLADLPANTLIVYAGDDGTDEPAFAALGNQITIRVGRTSHAGTRARYCLSAPGYMLRFLARMERELR